MGGNKTSPTMQSMQYAKYPLGEKGGLTMGLKFDIALYLQIVKSL